MDPKTERMIRNDIRLRRSPLYIAFWIFLGSILAGGLFGLLGFLDKFLRAHGLLH